MSRDETTPKKKTVAVKDLPPKAEEVGVAAGPLREAPPFAEQRHGSGGGSNADATRTTGG